MTEPDAPITLLDDAATPSLSGEAVAAGAAEAVALLEALVADRTLLLELDDKTRARLLQAAGRVSRPDPWTKRDLARAARRKRSADLKARDEHVLAQTGIRKLRNEPVFPTPLPASAPTLPGPHLDARIDDSSAAPLESDENAFHKAIGTVAEERACYVCKARYRTIHFFYDAMCLTCAEFNFSKRSQTADLDGRVALVTGARVKIGYQVAIMLLRAGAKVVATTRFPRDAAERYAKEADFGQWGHRLQIYGLDLRHTPSVELFAHSLCQTEQRLDFLINNACQTVRRPSGFYAHLMQGEQLPSAALPVAAQSLLLAHETLRSGELALSLRSGNGPAALADAVGLQDSAGLSQLALLEEDLERSARLYPTGALDQDGQQVDLRARNSWRLPLADVSAVELLEVQLVNAVAPFVLNARLKSLMTRHPSRDKHIVNVSAMEGQFYRRFKTDKHPHTNMAKAALNMMTRTSAGDYIEDGIHMNSVDTGWVTDEDAAEIAARKTAETGFHPPLDIVDGAARICDPIFAGFGTGNHVWGLFLKDYMPADW